MVDDLIGRGKVARRARRLGQRILAAIVGQQGFERFPLPSRFGLGPDGLQARPGQVELRENLPRIKRLQLGARIGRRNGMGTDYGNGGCQQEDDSEKRSRHDRMLLGEGRRKRLSWPRTEPIIAHIRTPSQPLLPFFRKTIQRSTAGVAILVDLCIR